MKPLFKSSPPARLAASLAAVILLSACTWGGSGIDNQRAQTELVSRNGSSVTGLVYFEEYVENVELDKREQRKAWLRINGQIRGLKPDTEHYVYLFDRGDCSAADATTVAARAKDGNAQLGMTIKADSGGQAVINTRTDTLSVSYRHNNVVDRALVVTDAPSNTAKKLACGAIRRG
jgi:superoxide dismutase, Cu-Zn family